MVENGQLVIIAALISGPLSALFAIIIGRSLRAFDRASKNREDMLKQEIDTLKDIVDVAIERFEKKQDNLCATMEKRDESMMQNIQHTYEILRQDIQHIQQRLEDLNVKTEVTTVRLDKLEQSFNNTSARKGIM